MNKQELEQAIENGESVWKCENLKIVEIVLEKDNCKISKNGEELLYKQYLGFDTFVDKSYFVKYLFKTKAGAEHYLHHANITRIETLPFLTWEEFNKVGKINFYDKNHCYIEVFINRIEKPYRIRIINHGDSYNCWGIKDYDYTEENFYKAYDECVKLFKGEE